MFMMRLPVRVAVGDALTTLPQPVVVSLAAAGQHIAAAVSPSNIPCDEI